LKNNVFQNISQAGPVDLPYLDIPVMKKLIDKKKNLYWGLLTKHLINLRAIPKSYILYLPVGYQQIMVLSVTDYGQI
jgi:hypothetical protein